MLSRVVTLVNLACPHFRLLVSGIGPPHMVDCKQASNKICAAVMGDADYQLGKTKVFLKVQ